MGTQSPKFTSKPRLLRGRETGQHSAPAPPIPEVSSHSYRPGARGSASQAILRMAGKRGARQAGQLCCLLTQAEMRVRKEHAAGWVMGEGRSNTCPGGLIPQCRQGQRALYRLGGTSLPLPTPSPAGDLILQLLALVEEGTMVKSQSRAHPSLALDPASHQMRGLEELTDPL